MGIGDATFYKRRAKYAGVGPSELRRLHQLEEENRRVLNRPGIRGGRFKSGCHRGGLPSYAKLSFRYQTYLVKSQACARVHNVASASCASLPGSEYGRCTPPTRIAAALTTVCAARSAVAGRHHLFG
jgi:hypothetical protein